MKDQNFLIMTIGLPYSGKTKWVNSQPGSWPIVCPDQIRYALHGERFIPQAEGFVWATAKIMVRSLFLAGHKTIVLDATSITAGRRDEWIDPLWMRKFIVMDVSVEACVSRAMANDDKEIVPIIERMEGYIDFDGVLYGQVGDEPMVLHIDSPPGDKQLYHQGRGPEAKF
jgi:predicted kinase